MMVHGLGVEHQVARPRVESLSRRELSKLPCLDVWVESGARCWVLENGQRHCDGG